MFKELCCFWLPPRFILLDETQSITKRPRDLFSEQCGHIHRPSTLLAESFLLTTKKGTSSEIQKDSDKRSGRNRWNTIPNCQRFQNLSCSRANSISIRMNQRANLISIRISCRMSRFNGLIVSDPQSR